MTQGLLSGFKVAGHERGRDTMSDAQLRNRIHLAASRGHVGAQALVRAFGAGVAGYAGTNDQWGRGAGYGPGGAGMGRVAGSPGFAMGAVAGYGVGRAGMSYGRAAGIAGYGVGENIPAGGGMMAPAASPLMGGFAPNPSEVNIGWIDPNVVMGAPLGFDSGGTTLVAAAAQFQLTSRPQEIFRGERFLIGSDIAPSLVVSDLKVGNRSQLINATNVPGMAFANTTVGASLRFETAQPGQDIVWTGVNIAGTPLRVLGCLVGSAAVRK